MADRSFFVTISQRTHFFVFGAGVVLPRPSTFAAFSERVSLIVPLLFSSPAFSFRFRQKNKRTYFLLWPLAFGFALRHAELVSASHREPFLVLLR